MVSLNDLKFFSYLTQLTQQFTVFYRYIPRMIFKVCALRRICPCFVIYLGGTVPALWFLQIDKLDRYNAALSANVSNLTDTLQEALSSIEGVCCTIVKYIVRTNGISIRYTCSSTKEV